MHTDAQLPTAIPTFRGGEKIVLCPKELFFKKAGS